MREQGAASAANRPRLLALLGTALAVTVAIVSTAPLGVRALLGTPDLLSPSAVVAANSPAVRGTAAQAAPLPPPPAICGEKRVFIVGDSLTVGAVYFGGMETLLAGQRYRQRISARTGRSTAGGVSVLRAEVDAGRLEPLVMVALGTNDITAGRSAATFASNVDSVMSTVGRTRIVVWVNMATANTLANAAYNRVLVAKSATYPNLFVLDWNATGNARYLTGDGIHYSSTGYRNRAIFSVDRLQWITCQIR